MSSAYRGPAIRPLIALACGTCGTDAGRQFRRPPDVDAWMLARGWRWINYSPRCPDCVAAAAQPTETPAHKPAGSNA